MTPVRATSTPGSLDVDPCMERDLTSAHELTPWQDNAPGTVPRTMPWMWQGLGSAQRSSLAFFELRTSRDWAGWQDAEFWTVLALPVSHQSRAVASSLIALSALHESMEAQDECYRTHLQRLSFLQGNEAIRALANTNLTYFEALVSCVVVLCFQNIQKSRSSFRLLRSGLKLLEERDGRVSHEEAYLIEAHVERLFDQLRCRPCRMGDPSAAFMLSVHRQRAGNPRTFLIHEPPVPLSFVTLVEARDCLQNILQWGHDTVAHHPDPHLPSPCFLESLHQLRRAWESALNSTLPQSPATESPTAIKSRCLLQAACIFGVIIIETASTTHEIVYDKYLADFRTIVQLVEQATSSRRSHSEDVSFGIDSGLVDIVAFVGSKCRDPFLRRRALQVLFCGSRVEGDRIASIPGEILRVHIDLEERGLNVSSCHDVPETHRRRLVRGQQVFTRRRIELFYIASPYDPALGATIEKGYVPLPGPSQEVADIEICTDTPDAIFGSGYAAYLEDGETQQYFRLDLDRFYFPIPRV